MKYNPNLDSLRGLAALAVIGFHCHILRCGWIGVQLFFVLSGYLITSILREQRELTPELTSYLRRFFARRILRLLPLYLLFLGVIAGAYALSRKPPDFPRAAPFLFTYTLNLARMVRGFPSPLVFSHLWSLGVEWQFYLVWPFVVWCVSPRSLPRLLLALVALAPLIRYVHAATMAGGPWPFDLPADQLLTIGNSIYNAPWTHFDAFAFGGLLSFPSACRLLTRPVVSWIVLGTTLVLGTFVLVAAKGAISVDTLGFPGNLPAVGEFVWGFTLLNASGAVVLAHVIEGSRMARHVTELGGLHYLGKISYGVYVWHACVVSWFDAAMVVRGNRYDPLNLLTTVAVAAITVGIASLSYWLFEVRFLRLKSRFAPLGRRPERAYPAVSS